MRVESGGGFIKENHCWVIHKGQSKGKALLLRYQQGSASTTNREKGFLEAIAKHPDIELVSDNQYSGATVPAALSKAENLIQKYKVQ